MEKKSYALTTHLLTKSDGSKFGKTEDGNIWLDSKKTSPYKFYQYWMNISDEDAEKWVKIFTTFTKSETLQIINNHLKEPHLRILQKELAKSITSRVHGVKEYEKSVTISEILFGKHSQDRISQVKEDDFLMVFEGVDRYIVNKSTMLMGVSLVNLLTEHSGAFTSKGEVRRLIKSRAISINKVKYSEDDILTSDNLLHNKYFLIQKGKKKYIIISVE